MNLDFKLISAMENLASALAKDNKPADAATVLTALHLLQMLSQPSNTTTVNNYSSSPPLNPFYPNWH